MIVNSSGRLWRHRPTVFAGVIVVFIFVVVCFVIAATRCSFITPSPTTTIPDALPVSSLGDLIDAAAAARRNTDDACGRRGGGGGNDVV
jgi:hypothetical protein